MLIALLKKSSVDPLSRNSDHSFKSCKYTCLLMLGNTTKKIHGEKKEKPRHIVTTSCMQKSDPKQQKT
jgi:hypothetical protein